VPAEVMKILHVLWRPKIGGAELFGLGLAKCHAATNNVSLHYLGARDDHLPDLKNPEVTASGMKSGFDVAGLLRFGQFVRNGDFDVIHVHQNLPAVAVALLNSRGSVLVKHEHGTSGAGWKTPRERALSRLVSRYVDVYIANSSHTRDQLIAQEHIPVEKVTVIPCGIDLDKFGKPGSGKLLRDELGLSHHTPVVGFVGRLHPQKGPEDFIAVAQEIHVRVPSAHYVLAGDGSLRDAVMERTRETGLTDCVHMLGARSDVPEILSGMDILLVTSRQETQGLVAVEAMAAGVPVIAFAVGGLVEVLGDAGTLITPRSNGAMAAAAVALLMDEVNHIRMVAKGHARAGDYNNETISRDILGKYTKAGI